MTVGGRLPRAIGTGGSGLAARMAGLGGPGRWAGGLKRASSRPGDPGSEALLRVHSKGQP